MTVSYNSDATTWSGMAKLLLRWRGSVFKAIWGDVLIWSSAYLLINLFLRQFCNDMQQSNFKLFQKRISERMSSYPLVFMLGFFSNVVFVRWVNIFQYIGFIDNMALAVATGIHGTDTETRITKRNIIRYAVLSQALVFRDISLQARRRFPDIDSLVDCGLMTSIEFDIYEARNLPISKSWIPIHWALNLVVKAKEEGKIGADMVCWNIQEKIREFRNNLHKLAQYDWVPVPLAYSQIIWIAVRCYFCLALVTSQILDGKDFPLIAFPYVAFIELLLITGWVNVAAVLINPFGLDDDDFEVNAIIDRNLTTGLAIVETQFPPTNQVDPFWSLSVPKPLDSMTQPADSTKRTHPYEGSVADRDMSEKTNDLNYQLKRARQRTLVKQMTTANTSAFSTPISRGPFCDGVSHRYSFKQSRMSTPTLEMGRVAPFHRLCSVCEVLEETSRQPSTSSVRGNDEEVEDVHSTHTQTESLEETTDSNAGDQQTV